MQARWEKRSGVHGLEPRRQGGFAIRPMCGKCQVQCCNRTLEPKRPDLITSTIGPIPQKRQSYYAGLATYSEYTVAWENNVVKVDPEVRLDRAALIGCAVITGVGAVVNKPRVRLVQQ